MTRKKYVRKGYVRKPPIDLPRLSLRMLQVLHEAGSGRSLRYREIKERFAAKLGRDVDGHETWQVFNYCIALHWIHRHYEWYYISESGKSQLTLHDLI